MKTNKTYIGSTRYIDNVNTLTSSYGYEGDTAYLLSDDKKIKAQYTKIGGEWKNISNNSGGDTPVTPSGDYVTNDEFNTVKEELNTKISTNKNDISDIKNELDNLPDYINEKINEALGVIESGTY